MGTPPCDRSTLARLPLLHWMAGHGEVCGVPGRPVRLSATEIQDILENPSIRQVFVVMGALAEIGQGGLHRPVTALCHQACE